MASAGKRKVLIIVENLPVPFDRRVWQEATTLVENGYEVSIICPKGKGHDASFEVISDIHIYRHPLPVEADGLLGYIAEYGSALFFEFYLAWKVLLQRGFDAIHACNPPDLIFLVGGFFRVFLGKKFLFDHHDINPELFEAKFNKRGVLWRLMVFFERMSFKTASVSIATNESYRQIAIERGGMNPADVFVVRSGPKLDRLRLMDADPAQRHGKQFLVGYVGVMGKQEGIDLLLRSVEHIVKVLGRNDIHFTLVGGGTELEALRQMAFDLGVSEAVTFTGRAPDEELLAVLNTADVCVNPDVANPMNDKSTMNKIMEYMALAKPIVQFDLTEGRFSAQSASLYARHNDIEDFAIKIVELLDDPQRREEMGQAGRERVLNELEWSYEAPKLLAAYERLLGAPAATDSDRGHSMAESPKRTGVTDG